MRVLLLALPLVLSGCVTELIGDPPLTTRTYACAVLDEDRAAAMVFMVWGEDRHSAAAVLRDAIANATARDVEAMSILQRVPVPQVGTDIIAWADERRIVTRQSVHLHVLFTPSLPENATQMVLAPGVIAIASDVDVLDDEHEPRTVLITRTLHAAGHAMGIVNQGIPINATDPTVRESPAGHEPARSSVMHASWHRGRGVAEVMPADRYSDGVRDDWKRAMLPGGVCA